MIVGQKKIIEFSFNQNQVIEFANITGDNNPIHLNDKYARNLFFKKRLSMVICQQVFFQEHWVLFFLVREQYI